VLDLDDQESWEGFGSPLFVEIVGFLLGGAVVAGELEALGVIGLEIVFGWLWAEAVEVGGEVAVEEHQGILGVGVGVEAFRQQDVCSEVHWLAPKLCKTRALDSDVADVPGVFGLGDGGDCFAEFELDLGVGLDGDLGGLGVEIAGGLVPLAAFATIGGEFEGVAVSAVEGFVFVEDCLDGVFAGLEV